MTTGSKERCILPETVIRFFLVYIQFLVYASFLYLLFWLRIYHFFSGTRGRLIELFDLADNIPIRFHQIALLIALWKMMPSFLWRVLLFRQL